MCCHCGNHIMYVVFMNQNVYLCRNKSIYLFNIKWFNNYVILCQFSCSGGKQTYTVCA